VVLADLSLDNPNVFYKVGVRHALCPSGMVLVCRSGRRPPTGSRTAPITRWRGAGGNAEGAVRGRHEVNILDPDRKERRPGPEAAGPPLGAAGAPW
jgi:hypothetical protein